MSILPPEGQNGNTADQNVRGFLCATAEFIAYICWQADKVKQGNKKQRSGSRGKCTHGGDLGCRVCEWTKENAVYKTHRQYYAYQTT